LDGYRMHARLDAGRVQILTRRGNDWTDKYPAIGQALAGLPAQNAYLDGELCGVLPDGRTAFNLIQNASDTGDVGSEHSMSFTVIGDTINTASRLQGLTRTFKTPLVVGGPLVDAIHLGSSKTATALASHLLDQGEQSLRGRAGPVRIWTWATSGQRTETAQASSDAPAPAAG
jgi:hypothetical protein